jgi:hypothetical protein
VCAYNERTYNLNGVGDDEYAGNVADSVQCGDVGDRRDDLAQGDTRIQSCGPVAKV